MGSISTGVGLISGIDTSALIQQLLSIDAQQKTPIYQRIGSYTASKTALLDVNARLLSLKSSASAFRLNDVFSSVLASSSNESVLMASANSNAIPGNYQFTVKQLVSTSQLMSAGFTNADTNPMGLNRMSFEWGNGELSRDVDLESLNGGVGVERGSIRITNGDGTTADIDLTLATTVSEVIDAINSNNDIQVRAELSDTRLVLVDMSGGADELVVENLGNLNTATDLGIEGTSVAGTLTGSVIRNLGERSLLSGMNDGNGVFIRENVADFNILVGGSGGTSFSIDLGRFDAPIDADTLLEDLNDGDGIRINQSETEPDFTIRVSDGREIDINLGAILDDDGEVDQPAVSTVEELMNRVNGALTDALGAGQAVMSINADGSGFDLTDNIGGGDALEVLAGGPYGDETATDLGIFTGPGGGTGNVINGSSVPNTVQTARATTIQDVIDRINDQTGGAVTASINAEGTGIALSAGGQLVKVESGAGDGSSFSAKVSMKTLEDLGFNTTDESADLQGDRILGGMGTALISTLNGGMGIRSSDQLDFTDRQGNSLSISGIQDYDTFHELISGVNQQLSDAGVQIELGVNPNGNGLMVTDQSGGTGILGISGTAASSFGILGDFQEDTVDGDNLQRQYVGLSTPLDELDYGRGVDTGVFRITDANGQSAEIDIGNDSVTLYDVIREINTRGLDVEAAINANGDGLIINDLTDGSSQIPIKIENVSGSTATDLGILGTAEEAGGSINGAYEKVVMLDDSDTMEEVIQKINDAGIEVEASLLNTGTGGSPYRMVLSSTISGVNGELIVDTDVNLGLSTLTEARNAKVFIGEGASSVLVESSTNQVEDVLAGISLDLVSASSDVVNVNIARDNEGILGAVNLFVTSFNEVVSRMNEYDTYDAENEVRGPLLGDSTVSRIRLDMYRTLQQPALGVDTQYRYLADVGIRVGKDGQIEFNEQKFKDAYEEDPQAVDNLFSAFESEGSSTETIAPGVTIDRVNISYSKLGFGDLFDQLVDKLTNSVDGTVTYADKRFQSLIDSANDRIERIDERLLAKQDRLQREFIAMETALAQLQSQQGSLGLIGQNMAMAQSLLG